ncbi:MAG: DNA repair protein RadC [Candidatus Hydrogenedentes bacterium]|nr:DNA repair protein RadC [Candidatus Hydrogenedentota bacterium]
MPENSGEGFPHEHLQQVGADALHDGELLAILFSTDMDQKNAVALAERVLSHFHGLRRLSQASLNELQQVEGITRVKAIEIKAALELGKRVYSYKRPPARRITKIEDAVDIIAPYMRLYETEAFLCLYLSTKNEVLQIEEISRGGMDWAGIQPRDVYRQALREGAHALILAHNHPSGDPEPSDADILVTKKLAKAADILGLRLLDHVIIGDGDHKYVSLKERGVL